MIGWMMCCFFLKISSWLFFFFKDELRWFDGRHKSHVIVFVLLLYHSHDYKLRHAVWKFCVSLFVIVSDSCYITSAPSSLVDTGIKDLVNPKLKSLCWLPPASMTIFFFGGIILGYHLVDLILIVCGLNKHSENWE